MDQSSEHKRAKLILDLEELRGELGKLEEEFEGLGESDPKKKELVKHLGEIKENVEKSLVAIVKWVLSYLCEIGCEIRQLQSKRRNETMQLEIARAEHDVSESNCTYSNRNDCLYLVS
jgi:hypothetical protein